MIANRRTVLRLAAATGMTALATACGSGDGGSGGEINFMGGSDTMELLHKVPSFEDWLRRSRVVVRPQFVPDDATALQKLAAGGTQGVNLVNWINQFRTGWQSLDLFAPIDTARIPNYGNVIQDFGGPSFAGTQRDAQGRVIGIPKYWAVSGIVYDSAEMPAPTSYFDLLDPKYRGRIAVLDDPGSMESGARLLGYDASKLTRPQLAEAIALVTRFIRQARALPRSAADLATLMGSGEVIACGVELGFLPKMLDQGKKSFRATVAMKEGGTSYGVLLSTVKNAEHTDAVHEFLNNFLTPEVGRAIAERSPSVPGIQGATKWLPDWYRQSVPVDDLPKLFAENPSVNFPPAKPDDPNLVGLNEFLAGWQQAKIAAKS